jgi:hypothetical protein
VKLAAATIVNGRQIPAVLTAIAIAVGVAACDRSSDRTASARPELMPTPPAVGAPPAEPAAVMPPKASAVLEPSSGQNAPQPSETGTPVGSGGDKPDPAQTAQGSDPNAKEPMTKEEESTAMPKPAQANDHSTTATDGKQ